MSDAMEDEKLLKFCEKIIGNPNGYNECSVVVAVALKDRLTARPATAVSGATVAVDREALAKWYFDREFKSEPEVWTDMQPHQWDRYESADECYRFADATIASGLLSADRRTPGTVEVCAVCGERPTPDVIYGCMRAGGCHIRASSLLSATPEPEQK